MASARDAQAGWNLYRASGYSLDLSEINEKLEASGFNPVAPRSYSHYRKLHRYGYQRYVPINQLDVETLRDPVWGGPLQSRYRPRPAKQSVELFVILDERLVVLTGELIQLSDVEGTASIVVANSDIALSPAIIEGRHTLVTIAGTTKAATIELVAPNADDTSVISVVFLFLGFVASADISEVTGLATSRGVFTISTEDQQSPVVIIRSLYSLFEAIDSARLVCDSVLDALGIADRFAFPPTRLNSLSVSSPLIADVSMGQSPFMVVVGILLYLEYLRRKHYEANITRGQAEILGAKANILEEHARSLRIKNDRSEFASRLDVNNLVTYIVKAVVEVLPEGQKEQTSSLPPDALERVRDLRKSS